MKVQRSAPFVPSRIVGDDDPTVTVAGGRWRYEHSPVRSRWRLVPSTRWLFRLEAVPVLPADSLLLEYPTLVTDANVVVPNTSTASRPIRASWPGVSGAGSTRRCHCGYTVRPAEFTAVKHTVDVVLWTLTKDDQQIQAVMRTIEDVGVELRILRGDGLCYSQLYRSEREVTARAAERRSDLEVEGWRPPGR
jgi:hypothetical protein